MATTNDTTPHLDSPSRQQAGGRSSTLGEQTSKVAEDVRELGHMAISGASEALKSAKERGGEVVDKVSKRGQEALEQGRESLVEAKEGFEGFVAQNPFKTVLIAVGIGALIGYSLRSRN